MNSSFGRHCISGAERTSKKLSSSGFHLWSYDVFDTVLLRSLPDSRDVFSLMEERLRDSWKLKTPFSKVRRRAEVVQRGYAQAKLTLADIYEWIRRTYSLESEYAELLKELELETEEAHSFLNDPLVNEIKAHVESGERVVLVSDMYLNANQIRKILIAKDSVFENITIYSSCEYGLTKKSGLLYDEIARIEGIAFSDWIHTGDSKVSDVLSAERKGIATRRERGAHYFDFERRPNNLSLSARRTYGICLQTRVGHTSEEYILGASFTGPIAFDYISWVINDSIRLGVKKLYFVLRDGYTLKKIADIIIKQRNLQMETEYIFGSRIAWRFPLLNDEKLESISLWDKSNWIFHEPAYCYVPFEKMGFSRKELTELFDDEFVNRVLRSFKDFKAVLDVALRNDGFTVMLGNKIVEARANLIAYLRSFDDFALGGSALVDTNTTGKTQVDLQACVDKAWPNEGRTVRYFYHTWLSDTAPDPRTQWVFKPLLSSDSRMPEALTRAPYKQCFGYVENQEGKTVPRFRDSCSNAWWGRFDFTEHEQGILDYSNCLLCADKSVDYHHYSDYLLGVANFSHPSKDILSIVSNIPFNEDLNGEETIDFYPTLKATAILRPFTELVYMPKGSFYNRGIAGAALYSLLYGLVRLKRELRGRE